MAIIYWAYRMSQPGLNQWVIDHPVKYTDKYLRFIINNQFYMNYTKKQIIEKEIEISHIFEFDQVNCEDYPVMRDIIKYISNASEYVNQKYRFIGYYTYPELRHAYLHGRGLENKFCNFIVLALDQAKLLSWQTFRETLVYINLPHDIRGEIFEYIYVDMIRAISFEICESWLESSSEPGLSKYLSRSLSNDDNVDIFDYWTYPAQSQKINTLFEEKYWIIPDAMPTYLEAKNEIEQFI